MAFVSGLRMLLEFERLCSMYDDVAMNTHWLSMMLYNLVRFIIVFQWLGIYVWWFGMISNECRQGWMDEGQWLASDCLMILSNCSRHVYCLAHGVSWLCCWSLSALCLSCVFYHLVMCPMTSQGLSNWFLCLSMSWHDRLKCIDECSNCL